VIAVVGGGISGLATAHALVAAGAGVVVLEADARPGGVIRTEHHAGRPLDTGPQRTRLTPPLRRLVDRLGLGDQLRLAPDLPLHVYSDGRLRRVPTDLAGVLTTDLLAWPDRLRALLEPFTAGVRPQESAADFFIRKFGRRTYRRAMAPLFGGLFASDPADMRARHALASILGASGAKRSVVRALLRGSRHRGAAPACTFQDGLATLTDALAASLGDRLRPGCPVRSIEPDGSGFRLVLDGETVTADRVVLACPSAVAGRLLAPVDRAAADRLSRLRVNRLATVHMESDAALGAMGFQVALDAGLATHGVTSQHDLFGRTGLYTAFLGGARRASVEGVPDRELAAAAVADFRTITGATARPLGVHRTAIPAWDTSWDALDDLAMPEGVSVCANWADRPGITGRLVDADRVARQLTGGAPA
jgi:oxygen-dependent protoporphyrinogen oxidase